jgi:hypothetical protein
MVVSGQVDMLPAEWGQVLQESIVEWLAIAAQGVGGALEIDGVPQNDGSGEKIQTACPVSLLLEATVAVIGVSDGA